MLGVNESRAGLGLALFAAACLLGLSGLAWYEVRLNTTDGVFETIIAIGKNMEWVVVVSAALVYVGVEGSAMIAERYLRKRYQDGRQDGRHEQQAAWTAWYQRWQAAQQRGERFDEPPPKMDEKP